MLRIALRRVSRDAAAAKAGGRPLPKIEILAPLYRKMETFLPSRCSSAIRRSFSAATSQENVAAQMIQYTLSHARSHKSEDSYAHGMLVLEQGLSNLRTAGGRDDADNPVGMLMLAMATLNYESGRVQDAMENLEMVHQLGNASLGLKVAAWESLVGLNLEAGQEANSSLLADDCSHLVRTTTESNGVAMKELKSKADAVKGLVDLVNGDLRSAEVSFNGSQEYMIEENNYNLGNACLSYGELLHCSGNFQSARSFYEKALLNLNIEESPSSSYSAAANMDPEEVVLGANCALGQLLSHLGKFGEAEEFLTKALVKAEGLFGTSHPKVGVVLICMALMYKHKAKLEASSSILIQEGLYRKAAGLLKAPSLDEEVSGMRVERSDIISLVRGGYAELLCIQQNRKEEGERMRKWGEATWWNRRMSLAQALEFSEPSNAVVVDTRICRVL